MCYEKGVRVHTNAWGNAANIYNTQAAELDAFVMNQPDMLVVFAGGNDGEDGPGTIGAPATCKNCISVGATQNAEGAFRDAGQGLRLQVTGLYFGSLDVFVQPASYGALFDPSMPSYPLARMLPTDHGCSDLGFESGPLSQPLIGKIAVIRRGSCLFVEKTRRAQALGAVAVIFTNHEDGPIPPLKGDSDVVISIPSGMISRSSGAKLWAQIGSYGHGIRGEFAFNLTGYGPNNIAAFSARGPAFDGRIKPDLVAPGQTVLSSRSDGLPYSFQCGGELHRDDAGIRILSGTSMAAPFVAGAGLLIRQYFREGRFPTGFRGSSASYEPTAALLKALLVIGAQPLAGTVSGTPLQPPPSHIQGWGRVQADRSVPFSPTFGSILGGVSLDFWYDDSASLELEEVYKVCFSVSQPGTPFNVVLTWTDPAAQPMAGFALVHDLDLTVQTPASINVLGNGVSQRDTKNNLEVVKLESLEGNYTVTVRGMNVGLAAKQAFALVVSGRFAKVKCSTPAHLTSAPASGYYAPPSSAPPSSTIATKEATFVCEKDKTCFDESFPCESCCSTGRAKNGLSCWDNVYTVSRCCNDGKSGIVAPVTKPYIPTPGPIVEVSSADCAKDGLCFDANYVCAGCCSTNKAKDGAPCWNGEYTQSRCCQGYEPVPDFASGGQTAAPVAPPPAPIVQPCAKDATCFDAHYQCADCCSTGKAYDGSVCWDTLFSAGRCCN